MEDIKFDKKNYRKHDKKNKDLIGAGRPTLMTEEIRREKIKKTLFEKYNIIGKKYRKLTVLSMFVKSKRRYCVCKCDCGKETICLAYSLKTGHTSSCGCLLEQFRNKNNKVYKTKNYRTWKNIIDRCYNTKNKRYKNYGGRGIGVCEEWLKDFNLFDKWAKETLTDEFLTIDRVDINGNYCPENCRWATLKEQSRNKTTNRIIKYKNKSKTLSEWCEIFNRSYKAVWYRINNNWDIEKALNKQTPTDFYGRAL